jgi:NAD(P)-dependent dehydrogenase (short-subunit alcohol dehydrogenase family)
MSNQINSEHKQHSTAELHRLLGVDRMPKGQKDVSVRDLMDLSGMRAVVTGGGGANLGKAIVSRLAGLGADVAIVDQAEQAAQAVANMTRERWGVHTVVIRADLGTWDGAHAAVDEVLEAFSEIDIWVNNVGGNAGMFLESQDADIQLTISMTLLTSIYCMRAVLPHMVAAGKGRLINISSEGAKMGSKGIAVYSSCKAAVDCMTRNLTVELEGTGVGIVAVSPGSMLGDGQVASLNEPDRYRNRIAAMLDVGPRIRAGRRCLPEEVANMVAFLATPAGAYVQGTSVSVGGGMSS